MIRHAGRATAQAVVTGTKHPRFRLSCPASAIWHPRRFAAGIGAQGREGLPPGSPGSRPGSQPGAPKSGPSIVGLTGAPISSQRAAAGGADPALGAEVEITATNAMQVLQTKGAILLQVGEVDEGITKKIVKLRLAAGGKLPLASLNATLFPQIIEALQIKTTPVIFLMAGGQVAAALENDLSPQAATGFVERAAKLLNLQVNLAEGVADQLLEAEATEWTDGEAADAIFVTVSESADLAQDARIRAAAGRARCAIRSGQREEAKAILDELNDAGAMSPEVKQALAFQWLDGRRSEASVEDLKAKAEAAPTDLEAAEAYAAAVFWSGAEGGAFDAGIQIVRKNRKSDEAKKLGLILLEALGPRHPRFAKARRTLNNTLFV